jgi:predicted nuclease with RNAse H fold
MTTTTPYTAKQIATLTQQAINLERELARVAKEVWATHPNNYAAAEELAWEWNAEYDRGRVDLCTFCDAPATDDHRCHGRTSKSEWCARCDGPTSVRGELCGECD